MRQRKAVAGRASKLLVKAINTEAGSAGSTEHVIVKLEDLRVAAV